MQTADISVVIPTRNRAAWLPTCLAHLEQQTYPAAGYEVLVVDDGSTDETVSVIERFAAGSPVCVRLFAQARQGLAAARNLGVREAAGEILLFLCDDELASPRLLERHLAARRSTGADACIMGEVRRHPQLPPNSFTRLALERPPESERAGGPGHFLDWHRSNFSIPRAAVLDAGGFETEAGFEHVEVLELAFRLEREGVEPLYLDDARAYVWQPTSLAAERGRQYQLGYGLQRLQHRTRASRIPEKFRLRPTRLEQFMGALTIPYYARACHRHEVEAGMLVSRLHKRVLYHDRVSGYQDACQDRPPRPPTPEGA